mmetsp:Transcript_674/g.493  ORF Transcript_674/g.493 Transcript_674/m.493 type:complete len:273 (-) Transcript_674:5-823(-)
MKPIYFPFTYISKQSAEKVAKFSDLEPTVTYLPSSKNIARHMSEMHRLNILDLRIAKKSDNDNLDIIIKSYKDWAELHQGSELSFFAYRPDKMPYYDETVISKIMSDIKKAESKSKSYKTPNNLIIARLFLYMAQEFDKKNYEIDSEIIRHEKTERDFINALTGEDKKRKILFHDTLEMAKKDDLGNYMTAGRVRAWSYLFFNDTLWQKENPFFITDSKAVFDYMVDKAQEVKTKNTKVINSPNLIKKNIGHDCSLSFKDCMTVKISVVVNM